LTDLRRLKPKPRKLDNEISVPTLRIHPNATLEIHSTSPGATGILAENYNVHSEGRIIMRGIENPIKIRGGNRHYFRHLDASRFPHRVKTCLICGHQYLGKYCPVCMQSSQESK
jgi:hypothetical protein